MTWYKIKAPKQYNSNTDDNNTNNNHHNTYSWMTPLCKEAQIQGRTGWKAKPFTRADLDSNFVNMIGESQVLSFSNNQSING